MQQKPYILTIYRLPQPLGQLHANSDPGSTCCGVCVLWFISNLHSMAWGQVKSCWLGKPRGKVMCRSAAYYRLMQQALAESAKAGTDLNLQLLPSLLKLASASASLQHCAQPQLADGLLAIYLHQTSLATQVRQFSGHDLYLSGSALLCTYNSFLCGCHILRPDWFNHG